MTSKKPVVDRKRARKAINNPHSGFSGFISGHSTVWCSLFIQGSKMKRLPKHPPSWAMENDPDRGKRYGHAMTHLTASADDMLLE
jgi:hypothetical protein